jgi:REP element-mobilizing transposase RayT
MRSRYRVVEANQAQFITSTIVSWLPVFTTNSSCDVIVESLLYCREQKGLKIHGWVILDNHFHAVVSGPDIATTISRLKSYTARKIVERAAEDGRDWLLNQFEHFRRRNRSSTEHQVWQEGFHPKAIVSDEIMQQKLTYIHNNPVERGLVSAPEHWRYSSAHEWLPGAQPLFRCDPWNGNA